MLLAVILAVAVVIYYLKLKYYTLRGPIPGLAPQFLLGNLMQSGMLRDTSLPLALKEFKSRYGDIFQFWIGARRWIIVSNIKDVQHIFTHRQIYDQGFSVSQTVGALFPDGLTACKG
ncbi:unnamed protein product [Rotaria magnacalcarata]|uniref:Cytochrome P450 n=1 Tax=Rotaria magnacalcarata TaxID=392030 RepID=A0A816PV69_9BILA|nr:unnamed protein product [Rotaria magnacalcarata]CAF2070382.1 unnamed protein product [Rotaria magnacalcarata]